jgi:predicted DNA binding protein
MANKLKALKLEIFHQGCFGSLVTEKFPGVSMKLVSNVHLFHNDKRLIGYQIVVEATCDDPKELDSFLDALKNFKTVQSMEVWAKAPKRAFLFIKVRSLTSSYEEVLKKGAMHFDNIRMERGFDVHSIVTTNFKDIKSVLEGLEEIGEVKVTKIGSIDSLEKKDLLTEKQVGALRTAISYEYYSWPRKATLESLARQCNTSRRAFQEHLRKAESKLFPELVKDYLLTKQK